MLVSGGVRRFKCCVISAPEGAFGRFQACVIYIGLGSTMDRSAAGPAIDYDVTTLLMPGKLMASNSIPPQYIHTNE